MTHAKPQDREEPLQPEPDVHAASSVKVWCATSSPDPDSFAHRVRREMVAIGNMLIAKNEAYGNSALDPVRIFSRADTVEQIKVRIDDKLSRLKRGFDGSTAPDAQWASEGAAKEDVVMDLIGYLVLLRLAGQKPAP